jgi:hypothetical protein
MTIREKREAKNSAMRWMGLVARGMLPDCWRHVSVGLHIARREGALKERRAYWEMKRHPKQTAKRLERGVRRGR